MFQRRHFREQGHVYPSIPARPVEDSRAPAEDMQSLEMPERSMLPVVPALACIHCMGMHMHQKLSSHGCFVLSRTRAHWRLGMMCMHLRLSIGIGGIHMTRIHMALECGGILITLPHWHRHSCGPETQRDLGCPSSLAQQRTCALSRHGCGKTHCCTYQNAEAAWQ